MGSSTQERRTIQIDNEEVDITSLDKKLWPNKNITKATYLQYLNDIAPRLLSFLENRLLTLVRYPDGVGGQSFYQKNCPSYAPAFVQTQQEEDIHYIVCSDLPTLIWLGNQGAIEFHVPFQTIHDPCPAEIVFDLDPPSIHHFSLAVEAAQEMKTILDRLKLTSFVKTSGNTGLQIYIPLPQSQFTYEQTKTFTKFLAMYLVHKNPRNFTTERLKSKRGMRLYIDYLQHAAGKTIIAPYSPRGNDKALVATPLFWEEVDHDLSPTQFPLESITARLKEQGCPWKEYEQTKKNQPFQQVLDWLKQHI